MESWLVIFCICLALGSIIGFMAGLLGIGGGLIAVPALLYFLPNVGVPFEHLPHVAIATSLAAIILTSLSSALAHNKRGNIPWGLFKPMLPGFVVGAICSGFVSKLIDASNLQQAFAFFVVLMALQMAFPIKPSANESMPKAAFLFIAAAVIALIAGLMGIGGGVLLVPFLTWCGLQMRNAVGFAAATGLLIALFGSIGYSLAGWNLTALPQGTFGFIYVPALVGIVITSMLTAPLGAKAATKWPTALLKKIFAGFLAIVGLKLMLT
ncbi:sulfite exporter TauE/SafE family protein [Shewanella youngdeokensis]|uniref:Probable membrane transporter protein n=1 Tax=Shewanella youngdeokensis TaxID=2999068 RepID=A0ABZ0JXV9_9GAMM|nr:sulfite exporter TauE/SafE family protein [Shewanella sp. DAU334]